MTATETATTTYAYRDPGETPWTFNGVAYTRMTTDAEGKSTYQALDAAGRLIITRLPDGSLEEQGYYENGSLKEKIVRDAAGSRQAITYRYLPDGALWTTTYPDGGYLEYEYDAFGRKTAEIDHRVVARQMGGRNRLDWSYDALGRVATQTLADGRVFHYTYSATGQRTAVTITNGAATEYQVTYDYDTADRLDRVYDTGVQVADFAWDANGNRAQLDYTQLGASTMYSYNAADQLTIIQSTRNGDTLALFSYTVDGLGRRASATEQLRTTTGTTATYGVSYTYDQLSRLLSEIRTKDGATLVNDVYEYDKVGNRLSKNGHSYTYDADKLTRDAENNPYTYDANGNQLTKAGWAYEYDWDHQLTRATAPDGTIIEFWYDTQGHRLRKAVTVGGTTTTTHYVVDAELPYAQVLLETDGAHQITAKYTYADDLLKVSRNGEYYYFTDGLGSTRLLTDATGAVVNRYTYDAYGTQLPAECEATVANEYLFTGERYDADTGLVYLRARYYDPTTGGFVQRDSYTGSPYDPASLHRYGYCHANPVNGVDPSGHPGLRSLRCARVFGGGCLGRRCGGIGFGEEPPAEAGGKDIGAGRSAAEVGGKDIGCDADARSQKSES